MTRLILTAALFLAACTPYTPSYEDRPATRPLSYYILGAHNALWGDEGRVGR